jgi:hypothetical protein
MNKLILTKEFLINPPACSTCFRRERTSQQIGPQRPIDACLRWRDALCNGPGISCAAANGIALPARAVVPVRFELG